jgi:hypothetical protein
MTEQEEKQTSIKYLIKKINQLEKDLIQAEEHRKKSLKIEFEKGYEEGVKYTDGLISEERNPF